MLNCIARLDYDSREQLRAGVERMRFLLDMARANNAAPGVIRAYRHRTRRGWHVEVMADLKLTPSQMVALQAILGSDYRRESFNLIRSLALPLAPRFWNRLGNWNVLHRERI